MIPVLGGLILISCNDGNIVASGENALNVKIKEEAVDYVSGTAKMKGYITFNENKEGKRPGVLVVHEWWGLNDYPRKRAKQLAEMGYIAMAVDMFGDGRTVDNPQEAQALTAPLYQNPMLGKIHLDAALNKLKTYVLTDTANIAAIGYCFGGFVVLNAAKLGSDLKGVVSFHGNLFGVPPDKNLLKAKILVCNGDADSFIPKEDIYAFKKGLDSVGAYYTFKSYPNATHAFTNPDATEKGKEFNLPVEYNATADTASWNEMTAFLKKIFPRN
jgi:dienelactone hydrolase